MLFWYISLTVHENTKRDMVFHFEKCLSNIIYKNQANMQHGGRFEIQFYPK
ncbi:hypothetical protein DYY67_1169 [Candidatus Nitrosotalea sp. TS]|nr:hypothetical protein [Candidatus Nitrosotalea sp. TS]